jgi:predicted metalloprotease with PDZ domain
MAETTYRVSFPDRNEHYVDVSIELQTRKSSTTTFSMPVWTPGSYKVREFSQNMEFVEALSEKGKKLKCYKTSKNDWQVEHKAGEKIIYKYQVYAFVKSVRQSYVDQFYAFLHGVSVFAYAKDHENETIDLIIDVPSDWKTVQAALPMISQGKYEVANYDLLADSPIALGNFDVGTYQSGNVEHRVVMIGPGNYNLETVVKDFKAICDVQYDMFKVNPAAPVYIHFIQNVVEGGGGLEHLNSQTSAFPRWSYQDENAYRKFLGLIAHEYFHLWNVKRIRPEALGPFDYDRENYTTFLWQAEGFTSYYDDHFIYRSGFFNEEQYLSAVEGQINRYESTPGKKVMSLNESSFDAWIKAYYPNENSSNTTVSYYNKGMLVALMLDFTIIKASKGDKNLDHVMRELMDQYTSNGQGYEAGELKELIEKVCGKNLDKFFDKYVNGTEEILWQDWFTDFGVVVEEKEQDLTTGIDLSSQNGKLVVNKVLAESAGVEAGVSVNDEFLAIDGHRVQSEQHFIQVMKDGKSHEVLISRDGIIRTFSITAKKSSLKQFNLSWSEDAESSAYKSIWLRKK